MNYPDAIEVDGIEYPINTGYEYGLACFACINDAELCDIERAYGVVGILFKEWPHNEAEASRLAVKYLQCGQEPKPAAGAPDMSFEHDIRYIRSSFRSDYGIDLNRAEGMHWWEFSELLQGLTDDCILNRVRDLRNYDTTGIKDTATRAKIRRAQRDVALPQPIDPEDQDALDAFYAQLK